MASTSGLYDTIVIGAGAVGSAVTYYLAKLGRRVLAIDRFAAPHDRGSSHGQMRLIRQAYFEHPHYVPLVQRAYKLWRELEQIAGEQLYDECGVLEAGPADCELVQGVRRSALEHRLPIEEVAAAEVTKRFVGFRLDDNWQALFEQRAGFLRPEACIAAYLRQAAALGAEVCRDSVRAWQIKDGVARVVTDCGAYEAESLVIAAGSWSAELLGDLNVALTVLRKPQHWFATAKSAYLLSSGTPGFVFQDKFADIRYGFPVVDAGGMKVARHTGGQRIENPLQVDRTEQPAETADLRAFLQRHFPLAGDRLLSHTVCLYTMSPDGHFIVDRHPRYPNVCFAAGLSGHGFKFSAAIGEYLAQLATAAPFDPAWQFLRANRFEKERG